LYAAGDYPKEEKQKEESWKLRPALPPDMSIIEGYVRKMKNWRRKKQKDVNFYRIQNSAKK